MSATRLYTRPFVGITGTGDRELFRSIGTPGNGIEGKYVQVKGPFKTTRGAAYFKANPTILVTLPVKAIERLAVKVTV